MKPVIFYPRNPSIWIKARSMKLSSIIANELFPLRWSKVIDATLFEDVRIGRYRWNVLS